MRFVQFSSTRFSFVCYGNSDCPRRFSSSNLASGCRNGLSVKLRRCNVTPWHSQLISDFSGELVRSVMAGDLNLALVTAPPENSQITAAAFGKTRLYAALPQN